MFANYWRVAFRNFWKYRGYTLINLLCLATALTACMLIHLYVSFELSYDNFHSKSNRIFRITTLVSTPTETRYKGSTWAFGPQLKRDFPEVEAFVRFSRVSFLVRRGSAKFQEEKTVFADSSLFKMFDFKLLMGNPETALSNPQSIVFTKAAAHKYFGNTNPVGQYVLLDAEGLHAMVTGITEDITANSTIQADMFLSASTMKRYKPDSDNQWDEFEPLTYLLLKENISVTGFEHKLPAFLEKYAGKVMADQKVRYAITLERLRDLHLNTKYGGGHEIGNYKDLGLLILVAIFTLATAAINFINLSSTRAIDRTKEVGIRKTHGAGQLQLTYHFTSESLLISLAAFLLALASSIALRPILNDFVGKEICYNIFEDTLRLFTLLPFALVVGIFAGIYPSLLVLASPVSFNLKESLRTSPKANNMRHVLVISQLTIACTFILVTSTFIAQIRFMQRRNLGFDQNQILVMDADGDAKREVLREAMKDVRGGLSASRVSSIPGKKYQPTMTSFEDNEGNTQVIGVNELLVDANFITLLKLKVAAGRIFSPQVRSDSSQAMIINATTAKLLGYRNPQLIIGKAFEQSGVRGTIIGVVSDFHFESLQEKIQPLTMRIEPDYCNLICVKIPEHDIASSIALIERQWNLILPDRPFSYYFLDDKFEQQYKNYQQFVVLFINFSSICILISFIGLIGMISYRSVQRRKEIAIRKVVGGSLPSIILLMSREVLAVTSIAFLISLPIAAYFSQQWLVNFTYRTSIPFTTFGTIGVATVTTAVLTSVILNAKASCENPVEVLRS
ncbi:MAG: ABC transporter permease [Dyadobacter fermentans]